MLMVFDAQKQSLVRILYSHSDSINDLVIKDYQPWDETISFITGGKDNSLRSWNLNLTKTEIQSVNAVEGDLKRVLFLDAELKRLKED